MTDFQPGDTVTFTATGSIDSLDGKGGCLLTIHGESGIPFLLSQLRLVPTSEVLVHLERMNLFDEALKSLLNEEVRPEDWRQQVQRAMEGFGKECDWFAQQKIVLKWVKNRYELDTNE